MDASSARKATIDAYQTHAPALTGYAHRLTRDEGLAQDVVQETFLRFFLSLLQGEEIKNPSAWLHRVAHNYARETQRSAAVRQAVSLEDFPEEKWRDERSGTGVEGRMEWAQTARLLLAPREWQCVSLRAEGFDYTEIAAALAIRPGTVGVLLHRATEKLRNRLRVKWRSE